MVARRRPDRECYCLWYLRAAARPLPPRQNAADPAALLDIPLRASLVATLVATVVTTSSWVGPKVSGMIALFPIVFTSMMLILHPRIGGPPTAAVLANSAWGLIGLGIAIAVLHVTAPQFGSAIGLSLRALATCVGWNLGLWWLGRRKALRARNSKFDGYRCDETR